ncbi:hypothetical protein CGZ93_08455 [Enemella dayhoffiae]|uniref:Uncharacterized protein n=1 Tax=Enemella dayhoffiae TaxID=2016507 RepID=A0A255H304_9ACTN|nr:hypothetical protein CGZ93_08455 [Enemella dayhoffiae]
MWTPDHQPPGQVGDRVADRMMVASWREWFPGDRLLHPSFLSMSVIAPSGPPDQLWQRVELLGANQIEFTPWHPQRLLAVPDNTDRLAGVPRWFRDPDGGIPIWPLLLAHAGQARIPVPPPKRGRVLKDHPLGAPQGVAGPIGPPPRLLGL